MLIWHAQGHEAGVDPAFIICLCEWMVGSLVCSMSVVMPDQARLHALGVQAGLQMAAGHERPNVPRRLAAVK